VRRPQSPFAARAQQAADAVARVSRQQTTAGHDEPPRRLPPGLKEAGFAEGENVSVVYRWAENRLERLSEMATELVRQQAAVIVTTGGPTAAFAAKAATATISIVFLVGEDPVRLGLAYSHPHQTKKVLRSQLSYKNRSFAIKFVMPVFI
jgi:putative ABC transport system substrate-binding protein